MNGHTLTENTTTDGMFRLCECGFTVLAGLDPVYATERHELHLRQVAAEQLKPWRCDECGAPESLIERGLFHVEGFHDFTDSRGFVQPDAWYCEICYWRFHDEYDDWCCVDAG